MEGLVRDLSESVEERIRNAFDLSRISKEIVAKGKLTRVHISVLSKLGMIAEPPQASQGLLYKSRVRTEPTNITAPQFAAALWTRIESLVEEMAGCCIKVGFRLVVVLQAADVCVGVYSREGTQSQKGLAQWRIIPRRNSQGLCRYPYHRRWLTTRTPGN